MYLSPGGREDEDLLHAVGPCHGLVHDALEVQGLPAAPPLVRRQDPLAVRVLFAFALDQGVNQSVKTRQDKTRRV